MLIFHIFFSEFGKFYNFILSTQINKMAKKKKKKTFPGTLGWIIFLIIVIAVGYFSYDKWGPYFKEKILNQEAIEDFIDHNKKPSGNPLMDNVWVNEMNAAMLTIEPSGNYKIDIPSVENRKVIHGHYTIDKDNIYFMNHPSSNACVGLEGVYKYKIKENTLIFEKVIDRCKSRNKYMKENWISYESY